ncbi:hypothetical protein IQK56_13305 [Pseudomonas sp. MAFF 301449]|uniref:Condensation domain-containing protein n=1 Tax=Pseudomonas cyclaminis TaxID=2781239 RepID=A0ABR9SSF7_9PSED|nr:hypothetical protein [Pseudomonas cyclaminis]
MALHEGLKALSARTGVTLYSTMLAAFQILLHRLSGSDDVLVAPTLPGASSLSWKG